MSEFKTGDPVVYRKTKYSSHPGPRARNVSPSRHGDAYAYCVDKLWLVVKLKSPDRIEVITRRGKRRELSVEDPNLRPATWLDRLRYWGRFPRLDCDQSGIADAS